MHKSILFAGCFCIENSHFCYIKHLSYANTGSNNPFAEDETGMSLGDTQRVIFNPQQVDAST